MVTDTVQCHFNKNNEPKVPSAYKVANIYIVLAVMPVTIVSTSRGHLI